MSGRPGSTGRRSPISTDYADDLRDPADGEKVPRCAVCGVPERRSIVGRWDGDGRTYRVRMCARCIGHDAQPNPDPLSVPEAA